MPPLISGRAAALDAIGRGTAAFRAGDIVAATQHWSAAIQMCRQSGEADLEAQALARRGEAYRVEGYWRDAGSDLAAALAKAEASRDTALIAAASGALGNLAFMSRRSAVAEPLLQRSRDLARRSRDWTTLAAAENDLGNLYAATGRPAAAANEYEQAIGNAATAGDPSLAATAETNAARLALGRGDAGRGDTGRAVALLQRAVATLEQQPPSFAGGMALVSAGSAVFERDGPVPPDARAVAERAFRAADGTATALRNPTLASLAQGGLGHLDERANRLDEAAALTDRAALAAQQAGSPDLSFRWDWQRARLARRRGDTEAALAAYRRAVAELQSVRQDIPVEYRDGRSSYRATFGPLYLEFADLLAAPRGGRSGGCAGADPRGARHDRAAQGKRAAGLFPRFLRRQFRGGASGRSKRSRRAPRCFTRSRCPTGSNCWSALAPRNGNSRSRSRSRRCAGRCSSSAKLLEKAHDQRIPGPGAPAL